MKNQKKFILKIAPAIIFDDIINILIDENHTKIF